MKYKDTKVWLRVDFGVTGIEAEEMNEYIREYNGSYSCGIIDFWDWLRYEKGIDAYGFSALWNDKNPQMNKLIKIKNAA